VRLLFWARRSSPFRRCAHCSSGFEVVRVRPANRIRRRTIAIDAEARLSLRSLSKIEFCCFASRSRRETIYLSF